MAELFDRDKSTISRHIGNIFAEDELDEKVVVAKIATTTPRQAKSKKGGRDRRKNKRKKEISLKIRAE